MNIYKSIPTNKSSVVIIVVLLSLVLSVAGTSAQDDETSKVINDLCVNGLVNLPVVTGGFNVRGGEPSTQSPITGRLNKGDSISIRDVVAGEKVDGRTDWVNLGDTDNDGTLEYAAGALVWPKVDMDRILVYKQECKTTPEQLIPPAPTQGSSATEILVDQTSLVTLEPTGGRETIWTDYVPEAMATEIEEAITVARDRAANAIGISPELLTRVDITNGKEGENFRFASLFYVQDAGLIRIAWAKDQGSPDNYFAYNPIVGTKLGVFNVPNDLQMAAGFDNAGRTTLIATASNGNTVQLDTTQSIGTGDGDVGKLFVGDPELQKQIIEANKHIPFGVLIEADTPLNNFLNSLPFDQNIVKRLADNYKQSDFEGSYFDPNSKTFVKQNEIGNLVYFRPVIKTSFEQSWYKLEKQIKLQNGPIFNFYVQDSDLEIDATRVNSMSLEEIDDWYNGYVNMLGKVRTINFHIVKNFEQLDGNFGGDTGGKRGELEPLFLNGGAESISEIKNETGTYDIQIYFGLPYDSSLSGYDLPNQINISRVFGQTLGSVSLDFLPGSSGNNLYEQVVSREGYNNSLERYRYYFFNGSSNHLKADSPFQIIIINLKR